MSPEQQHPLTTLEEFPPQPYQRTVRDYVWLLIESWTFPLLMGLLICFIVSTYEFASLMHAIEGPMATAITTACTAISQGSTQP